MTVLPLAIGRVEEKVMAPATSAGLTFTVTEDAQLE
jgi:hypothetical protein